MKIEYWKRLLAVVLILEFCFTSLSFLNIFNENAYANNSAMPHHLGNTQTFMAIDTLNQADFKNHVIDLQLNSILHEIVAGTLTNFHPGLINVGGHLLNINANSVITTAEAIALHQVVTGHQQELLLGLNGNAIGGSLNLTSFLNQSLGSLDIPSNVNALVNLNPSHFDLSVISNFENYGNLYGFSALTNVHNFNIHSNDILNSGLISTVSSSIPVSLNLSVSHEILNPINLNLTASHEILNQGVIISSGLLNIASPVLTQIPSPNLTASLTGTSVDIFANVISNQGSINAQNGNLELNALNSVGSQNLVINNLAGLMEASQNINIASSNLNQNLNIAINGGELLAAKEINFLDNLASINAQNVNLNGVLNMNGVSAHIESDSANLNLGNINIAGDPTYYNHGNINITGNVNVNQDLAIIASGNITRSNNPITISAQAAGPGGNGYNIEIIAGANITTPATGGSGTLPPLPTSTIVTFNGASSTGGNINLGGSQSLHITTTGIGGNSSGGNVTIAAFESTGGANGRVLLPTSSIINTSGVGSGVNGDVTIIAGANNRGADTTGAIIANGGLGGGGNVSFYAAQPTSSDGNPITFGTNGSITSGNILIPSATLNSNQITVTKNISAYTSANFYVGGNHNFVVNNNDKVTTNNGGSIFVEANNFTLGNAGSTLNAGASSGALVSPVEVAKEHLFLPCLGGGSISFDHDARICHSFSSFSFALPRENGQRSRLRGR